MAVAVEMKFRGATLDQYDQVIEKMGFSHHGTGAPASLFHWVSVSDDGIKVVDVWESPEAFQAFAEEQIGPYTQEVGLPEPQVTPYPVHNYMTGPAA